MDENNFGSATESPNCFKEAVCIDAMRVYDSCGDKSCLEDLRVYFTPDKHELIEQAANVRLRSVDVITVYLDLEPVPFNKGFYSVDMTFFFDVCLDLFCAPASGPVIVSGISIFNKKVVLYGSEGNVKMFNSDNSFDEIDASYCAGFCPKRPYRWQNRSASPHASATPPPCGECCCGHSRMHLQDGTAANLKPAAAVQCTSPSAYSPLYRLYATFRC